MQTEDATIRGTVPTALAAACDCELSFTTGGDAEWFAQSAEYYADNDAAQSGTIGSGQETWMQTTVVGPGNVSFRYKMSSVSGDSLAFYIDTNIAASWSSGSTWPWTGNFAVPSGTHTLKWKYYKYSGSTAGSCWIDAIQWSGGVPESGGGADWEQITYTYDPSGRRIAKDVDGEVTKYVYDGDQCIAEYDANDVLLRKYIHGPCIDEPICMIEAAGGYAGTYYYHYDALGSVVALSDADGETVQVYEYDVYGQVAASDPNHPNRFLFTGREFDKETGLYYYRARYYNPTIGRFLQTDPIGYGDGMNWYAYCRNNAVTRVDPFGTKTTDDIENFSSWKRGIWSLATGRVLILPYLLEPADLENCKDFSEYLEWAEELIDNLPGPVSGLIAQYLDVASKVVDRIDDLAGMNRAGYRVFIEIKDYNIGGDPEDDSVTVLLQVSDPYWVEVKGLDGWLEGMGYMKWTDAVAAASRGCWLWYEYANWMLLGLPHQPSYGEVFGQAFEYGGGAPELSWFLDSSGKPRAIRE